jgi:hypothetical protein
MIRVAATGETGTVCEIYGELSIPGVTARPRRFIAALNDNRRWYR